MRWLFWTFYRTHSICAPSNYERSHGDWPMQIDSSVFSGISSMQKTCLHLHECPCACWVSVYFSASPHIFHIQIWASQRHCAPENVSPFRGMSETFSHKLDRHGALVACTTSWHRTSTKSCVQKINRNKSKCKQCFLVNINVRPVKWR